MFGLHFDNEHKKGSISFGGIPSNAHLKYRMKSYCNAIDEYTSWGCNLTSIKFGDFSQSVNYYAAFNSGFHTMIYSTKIFDFFANHILQSEIKKGICKIFEDKSDYNKNFICNQDIMNNNRYIEFGFGNMILKMKISDFFKGSNGRYSSMIFSNNFNMYKKYDILFGAQFFTLFSYLIFDYDNKKIEFYTNDILLSMVTSQGKTIIKILFIIIDIVCFITMLLSGLIFIHYHKN